MQTMNVYEMYVANGNRTGFWVQRDSWGNSVAMVLLIGGQKEGPLRCKPPYFGNPAVVMDLYDCRTRQLVSKNADLSCPGTFAYQLVEKPDWAPDRTEGNELCEAIIAIASHKRESVQPETILRLGKLKLTFWNGDDWALTPAGLDLLPRLLNGEQLTVA